MSHKTIGLLGGTTPESTVGYYQYITGEYTRRFGDYGYPQVLIYSVTFQELLDWNRDNRWDLAADKMVEAFQSVWQVSRDEHVSMRLGACMLAVDKVASALLARGIFP